MTTANKVKNYYGVYENDEYEYSRHYTITMIEERYEKTASGKSWKKNPVSIEEREILFVEYFNYLSGVEFFRNLGGYEKVEKSYTHKGHIPTRLTSISPNKDTKVVRKFKLEIKEN